MEAVIETEFKGKIDRKPTRVLLNVITKGNKGWMIKCLDSIARFWNGDCLRTGIPLLKERPGL